MEQLRAAQRRQARGVGNSIEAAKETGGWRVTGLGTMGEAMALKVVKPGTRLLVWNRTPAKAESLAAAGTDVAREAADVSKMPASALASFRRYSTVASLMK